MNAESFRRHYSKLPEATLLLSPDGRILEANTAAKQLVPSIGNLLGSNLCDLAQDPPGKILRFLELCSRSRDLFPGALTFKNESERGFPCRIEGGIFDPESEGKLLLVRLFSKQQATRGFIALNERISALSREVLERKRAEAKLYAQQQWLQTTLNSIGDAVVATDAGGRIVFANQVAGSLMGVPDADLTGMHLDEVFRIINEFTREAVESPVQKVLMQGTVVGLANDTVLIARDGAEIPIDDSGAPIRDEGGTIKGTVLVFRDVTARRRAEESSRLLVSVVQSSDDAIITKNLNAIITSWNKGAERIFGYSPEEAIGRPISLIAAPETADEMPRILERIKRGERIDHYQTIRKAKSGALVNISLSVSPVRDAMGRICGASKIARDITEQVRATDELAGAQESLKRTLEFDEAVMANMGEGLYTVDADGLVTYMNPTAERLFGRSFEELRGRKMHDMTHYHRPDGKPFPAEECAGFQVLKHGKSLTDHEDVFIRKDGTFFDVVYSSSPLRAGAEILGLVVVFRDVSEQKRAAEELRKSAEELRRANEDLNQFAFAASHDLQEPLRMITSYSQLLVKGYSGHLDGEAALCLSYITDGTRRMRELLADLLAYTQLNEGDGSAEATRIDLNLIFQKTVENLQTAIAETEAVVTADRLPAIYGHEPHFVQLLQNLIGNALKYRGGKAPRIRVSAQRVNDIWRLAVSDNGIGIAPKYHRTIFGVFKRLHGKEISGTGIGLAICQRVVDRYGGRIWVESQLSQGATFYCTLPSAKSEFLDAG